MNREELKTMKLLEETLRAYEEEVKAKDSVIQLQKEMNDENLLKEYVFKREDVPESERLIYKLDYLADNMDGIIDKQGRINLSRKALLPKPKKEEKKIDENKNEDKKTEE